MTGARRLGRATDKSCRPRIMTKWSEVDPARATCGGGSDLRERPRQDCDSLPKSQQRREASDNHQRYATGFWRFRADIVCTTSPTQALWLIAFVTQTPHLRTNPPGVIKSHSSQAATCEYYLKQTGTRIRASQCTKSRITVQALCSTAPAMTGRRESGNVTSTHLLTQCTCL